MLRARSARFPLRLCCGALGSSSHPAGVLRLLHRNSRKPGWRLQVGEGTRADVFSRLSRSRWHRRFIGVRRIPVDLDGSQSALMGLWG